MNFKILISTGIFFLFTSVYSFSQTNAGSDQEICTDHTVLAADPPPSGYIGTWSVISGSCSIATPSLYNTAITNVLEGFNELKWEITDGTNTYNDAVIITNNYPTQAYTAADEEICQNSYTLNANVYGTGESGLWSLVSGSGTIANPTTNATNVSGLASGINKFEWKITKGICHSEDTLTLTNNIITADAGTDQTTCENFANLTANNPAPGTGTWSIVASSGNPVFDNSNAFVTTVRNLGANTNSLQWTVVRGNCSDYANVIITSNKPTTADAGSDRIICENYTSLAGNNPTNGTGTWSTVSGAGNFADANAYNTQVNAVNTGLNQYEWKIEKNGCTSADTVNITYDYFVADAGPDDVTCTDNYTLNANNPSPGTGEWRVTGGAGNFADASQANTTVSGLITGDNTFEWKITHGACIHTDYVIVTRNTPSTANAGPDKETCNGETTLAAVNPAVGTGSWSIISGSGTFSNTLQNDATVTNIDLNGNIYRWTVQFAACSNYDEVTVTNNYVSASAGADQTVCGTTSTLNGNQPQSGETGKWQVIAGTSTVTNTNIYNSGVTGLVSGSNKFRWTISKGSCEDYDDIEITNNLYPASASVSGPSDICDDFASIIGNTPPTGGYGYWSIVSGNGIFDNSLDLSTVVRNLATGTNSIRWTLNKSGCEDYDDIQINRNSVFADAGADRNVCENYSVLNGNQPTGNLSGLWTRTSGSGNITNPSQYNTEVTNLTAGINTFKWTISGNGCTDSDEVQVTNNGFITSAGSNNAICTSYTSLTAADPSPGYGYWQVISGNGIFSAPSNFNTNVTDIPDLSTNTYRWTAFKNGCSDYDDVIITNNSIAADAGSDFSVCNPWATLTGNSPLPGTGMWTIQVGGGNLADDTSPTTQIINLSQNDNIIRWTITNNTCISYDEVTVTNNTVTATAGGDQAICYDHTFLSGQAPPTGGTGLWQIVYGNGDFADNTLYNTEVTNLTSGLNTFKWTIFNNGCSSGGDEVTINNKSFTADAGEDQTLPQFVTATNMAATLPSGGTGTWQIVSGGGDIANANDPSSAVTNLISGINQFQWTVLYNGCSDYDVTDITVINFQPNAGIDKTICSDSLKLNAQDMGGTPQYWSVIEGSGTFDDIYDNNTWVRNIAEGINRYRWTVTQNGATAYDEIEITRVNAYAGEDQNICENHTFLNGNIPLGSIGAEWSLVTGSATIISPTQYNTEVANINGGSNLFLWTVHAPNCYSSDYVNINYESISADAGTDKALCGSSTALNGNNPSTGTEGIWSVVSGNGVFENPSIYNTGVNNISTGNNIFRWTIYTTHCSVFDEVTILNDSITANAGEDQTVTHPYTYLNAVLPANSTGIWNIISGSGTFTDANQPDTYIDNLTEGDNIFTWTVNNANCSDADNVTITYNYVEGITDIGNNFTAYPNPTNGMVTIKLSEPKNQIIQVSDITGKIVIESKLINSKQTQIDLTAFPNGVYFIKLFNKNKISVIKIVKK